MPATDTHRALTDDEVLTLSRQGCTCDDWNQVQVSDGFRVDRVRDVHFAGPVTMGANAGCVTGGAGVEKPCGIDRAWIANCRIGDNVRIANIGVHLANYEIADGVCIEDVGLMESRPGATFGNGVEIEPLNEGGGRELLLFNDLDSQFASLICLQRHRDKLVEQLIKIARARAECARADRGVVGAGATLHSVSEVVDVSVGPAAVVRGAASLVNGTILSGPDAPSTVGSGVHAEDFIIAESSQVSGGAVISGTYVGQGCQIGKQFSAEGSLFFANCEGFHGEACCIFAGPYTVTHHKSSLLIAGLFSFYNAGSATNQSNHMYKLGPVHEGKLERGCKTGSFSYMMWPCRVGAFSLVLGKHTRTFDTADFPFSLLEATPEGRCRMVPGLNLATVGTVRDGAKWPARDRRRGPAKRDRITFDVLSPLTVGRMIRGAARLDALHQSTDRSVDTVGLGGVEVQRVLLRTGQKFYRTGIQMYLLDHIVRHVETALAGSNASLADALASDPDAVFSEDWVDLGGQMMPADRLDQLCTDVESGKLADLDALNEALDEILAAYDRDEWVWVKWAAREVLDLDLDNAGPKELIAAADSWLKVKSRFLKQILGDATKEFDSMSRTGFAHLGTAEDVDGDFRAVRGDYESNQFVRQMTDERDALNQRLERFKQLLQTALD